MAETNFLLKICEYQRHSLVYWKKIQCNSDFPNSKYNCVILFFETNVLVIYLSFKNIHYKTKSETFQTLHIFRNARLVFLQGDTWMFMYAIGKYGLSNTECVQFAKSYGLSRWCLDRMKVGTKHSKLSPIGMFCS